jgi:chemotaxis protein CheD
MNAPLSSLPSYFLKPGEMFVAEEPCVVSTLLGSCVAVTMAGRGIGAICHALLPSCRGGEEECAERFRHVECAVAGMVEAFARRGVPTGAIEAKLFGGAEMFRTGQAGSVGRQNIDRAGAMLAAAGIRVTAEDVGGERGRKILFCPHTGEVFMRRLNGMANRQAWGGRAA